VEGYSSLHPIADLIQQAQVALPLADFVMQSVALEKSRSIRKLFLDLIEHM